MTAKIDIDVLTGAKLFPLEMAEQWHGKFSAHLEKETGQEWTKASAADREMIMIAMTLQYVAEQIESEEQSDA